MDREKLARMADSVRTGGKGTVRRKHKAVHKARRWRRRRTQLRAAASAACRWPPADVGGAGADDVDGRQAAAEHAEAAEREHHPGHRGGEHLPRGLGDALRHPEGCEPAAAALLGQGPGRRPAVRRPRPPPAHARHAAAVQASISSNTYVISGPSQKKSACAAGRPNPW